MKNARSTWKTLQAVVLLILVSAGFLGADCNVKGLNSQGCESDSDCEDALPCTGDVCTPSGTCIHTVQAGACAISKICYQAGEKDPTNSCQSCDPKRSTAVFSPIDAGTKCDDGQVCTFNDVCTAGYCAGTTYSCDDLLACTDDACTGLGPNGVKGCIHTPIAGWCLIDKTCYAENATHPIHSCMTCNPNKSQTNWTAAGCSKCGNFLLEPGEECDMDDLGDKNCTTFGYEDGVLRCNNLTCKYDISQCTSGISKCGNGILDPGEECEGVNLGGKTCQGLGYLSGTLSCDASICRFDTKSCVANQCGNGILEPGEECDGTNFDGKSCLILGYVGGTLSCSKACIVDVNGCNGTLKCGNESIDPGEACDGSDFGGMTCQTFGYSAGSLTCTPSCDVNTSSCAGPKCGNGLTEKNEDCDKNDLLGKTCATLGFAGGTLACDSACKLNTTGCTVKWGWAISSTSSSSYMKAATAIRTDTAGTGLLVAGYSGLEPLTPFEANVFISHYNTLDGAMSWTASWGDEDFEIPWDILPSGANDFFIVGENYTSTSARISSFLGRGNSTGSWPWIGPVTDCPYSSAASSCIDNGHLAFDGTSLYLAGNFLGPKTFGSGSSTQTLSNTKGDVFLAKYDLTGKLIWVLQGASDKGSGIGGIALDQQGNIYIGGYFEKSITLGVGSESVKLIHGTTALGSNSGGIFVAKYSPSGSLQWARSAGGQGVGLIGDYSSLAYDASTDTIIVSGAYRAGAIIFSIAKYLDVTLDSPPAMDQSGFLAAISTTGSWIWAANSVTQPYGPFHVWWEIEVDALGNIFVAGNFYCSANFGAGERAKTISLTPSMIQHAVFVAKYNSKGIFQWVTNTEGAGSERIYTNGLAVDPAGNVYIAGDFDSSSIFFGQTTLNRIGSAFDMFVAQIPKQGP